MQAYLVCFDITDDGARRQVGQLLEAYGIRVQRSVFEISVRTSHQLTQLKQALIPLLEPDDDLRFYYLCAACRKRAEGSQDETIADFPLSVVI